jgi:hypothetical protein
MGGGEERRQGECSIGDATKSRSMGGAYLNINKSRRITFKGCYSRRLCRGLSSLWL